MSKASVFTMKLEAELRDAFKAEAEASHRPASQVVRELMRGYVAERQRERDRTAFLQQKVDTARQSVAAGRVRSNETVEVAFAGRRQRSADSE